MRIWAAVLCLSLAPVPALGQHDMGSMAMDTASPSPHLFPSDMSEMSGMTPETPMEMGRGWQPMTMGVVRFLYNRQGGDSGDEQVESSNWAMGMLHRTLGTSRISFMAMLSLEPATIADPGSPELFQTGESFQGQPLVDRQHPHDFFSNLSATYRLAPASRTALWLQAAAVGEPALGPTAFMHRASAGDNPNSPIGHHWQDSSHITSNVVTVGGGWRWLALEGSAFHGAEPDEKRWDLDGGSVDSYSGRVTFRLPRRWSAQISHGYLHHPEALAPSDTHRTTASLHYGSAGDGPFAATFLWGQNRENEGVSNAFLVEAAWQITAFDQPYARMEWVEKDATLLATKALPDPSEPIRLAGIYAFTGGYLRNVHLLRQVTTGLGGDVTVYGFPSSLQDVYGDFPVSVHVFLRLRWGDEHGHAMHGEG